MSIRRGAITTLRCSVRGPADTPSFPPRTHTRDGTRATSTTSSTVVATGGRSTFCCPDAVGAPHNGVFQVPARPDRTVRALSVQRCRRPPRVDAVGLRCLPRGRSGSRSNSADSARYSSLSAGSATSARRWASTVATSPRASRRRRRLRPSLHNHHREQLPRRSRSMTEGTLTENPASSADEVLGSVLSPETVRCQRPPPPADIA